MKHVLFLVGLFSISAEAVNANPVALTRVCALRSDQPDYLKRCTKLADDYGKIAKLAQRMYQPQSAAWDPSSPVFETPTVYWVQKFENALQRVKARVLDARLARLANEASWHTCFDANIVSGDLAPSPVTIATVNNYFPNIGDLSKALQIRLTVSEMMAQADACPPFVIVPTNAALVPFGFLAIYEVKDKAQAKICHDRQYAPAIIDEVNKIDPFLRSFARMPSSLILQ